MRITSRMRSHYLKVFIKMLVWLLCIFMSAAIGWRSCNRKLIRKEARESMEIYTLNKDMEAGEVLRGEDVCTEFVYGIKDKSRMMKLNEVIGKQIKFSMRRDTILSRELFCEKDSSAMELRKLCYSYIRNAGKLKKGDYIDVRIAFPNGADFIILSKKEVLHKDDEENGEGIWLGVTEEELLRMSSGVVDSYMVNGAYIYATIYMSTLQKDAIVNYPVNTVVEELIKKNPNIVTVAQEKKTLELRNKILAELEVKREETQQEEGLVYFE